MNEGSVPLSPLCPGSMPTVIPARDAAGADGCSLAGGDALRVAREARRAAGEAATSPAAAGTTPLGPVPPEPVAVLAQAVARQAIARQATTASSPARLARVCPVQHITHGHLRSRSTPPHPGAVPCRAHPAAHRAAKTPCQRNFRAPPNSGLTPGHLGSAAERVDVLNLPPAALM